MRIHFPAASTDCTVRPARGESSSTRESCGSWVSNLVTVCPARARWRVRAARNMVSPSGIGGDLVVGLRLVVDYSVGVGTDGYAPHLIAGSGGDKAAFFEKSAEEMIGGRGIVDSRNQETGAAGLPSNGDFGQFLSQRTRRLGPLRFV